MRRSNNADLAAAEHGIIDDMMTTDDDGNRLRALRMERGDGGVDDNAQQNQGPLVFNLSAADIETLTGFTNAQSGKYVVTNGDYNGQPALVCNWL